MPDWDAARYHRLSDPQWSWGLRVVDRLAPAADERILDIGCGTGRLTAEIRARMPSVRLVAIDRSESMLAQAASLQDHGIRYVQADATRLPFDRTFDAVFSTATLHWVPDHPALFAEVYRVLAGRGRLVAQAGGGPNLARLYDRAAALAHEADFSRFFGGWQDPWTFAGVDDTKARLDRAGFRDVEVWLESTPTAFIDASAFAEFVATVCLRHHLHRLPGASRADFLERITGLSAGDDPPFTLDYWRLNIDARK
jgi:trans-aconitate 2-methyltransferase